MAETSGFFDAVYDDFTQEYDLQYLASQFAEYFALFIGNGVFGSPTNQLRVSSGDGMTIKVSPGWAFINGYWYHNDEELTLSVTSNVSSSSRSDSVICRWDAGSRRISAILQVGSTEVTRDGSFYDLKLADILVSAGATSIPESNITDTRTDESVCGFVTQLLKVQTTADLFAQYEAIFNEWFNSVKDQVTGDLAIKLQTEFTELNESVEQYQTETEEAIAAYKLELSTENEEFKSSVSSAVDDIQETANTANSTIQTFVDNDFTIAKQTLTFVDGTCTILDDRVTENSLIDVYFTADSMPVAETAQIYVDSADGSIILTANTQPTTTLEALIRVRVM